MHLLSFVDIIKAILGQPELEITQPQSLRLSVVGLDSGCV